MARRTKPTDSLRPQRMESAVRRRQSKSLLSNRLGMWKRVAKQPMHVVVVRRTAVRTCVGRVPRGGGAQRPRRGVV